ncbi:hypothetical protein PMZ80_009969 [Knufia obscura]|uniref:ubiquitinyl hydrolase 1 n=2 Tax=Knufia TaxID=430999 RepID=A0AAN8IAU9_9EURO|nr:hypothetical protein PMZ80_009969 [Knufia obscura]KAK5956060.1 hypothetical protein OHC33_002633 [Knufia fluminis]
MAQMTPAEMEEFQNLSDKYQAELAGPLIGEKLPMNALVTEYAQADSTYVVKTTGLAATHGAYRAVKGDGQCGWRATVFSYFELLLHSGDPGLVQLEKIRFETFADMMTQIGMDYSLLADMFDYTWQLFDKVIEAVQNNVPDDNIILNILNDENPSNSVVYHFKMVTSAYMQLHPDDYEPFLEMPVDQYRVARIDPANQEIDQIGLQALTHAVIGAAGFGLEVLYLDRSVGDEVNAHQFSQSQQGNQTIRLLYRPGHYDIIYKDTQPMQVYLQPQHTTMTRMEEPQEFGSAHDFLFSPATMSTPQAPASYDAMFQPSGTYMQHVPYNNYYQPQHQPQMYTDMSWSAPPASQHIPPPMPMPSEPQPQHQSQTSTTRAHSSRSVTMSPSPPSAVPTASEPQIRMSSMMYNMGRHQAAPPGACTGSSANSPAYYDQHVDKFQPQMYNPSRDYDG